LPLGSPLPKVTLDIPPDFQGIICEDGLRIPKEADGAKIPVWFSFQPKLGQTSVPVLNITTTFGTLHSEQGRSGRDIVAAPRGMGVLFFISSKMHGKAFVTITYASQPIARMEVIFVPSVISILRRIGIGALSVVVLTVVIRGFILEADGIPSDLAENSMAPTFHLGERFFVFKPVFRIRAPHRGEIVVMKPNDPELGNAHLLKRVVGIPGDTLEIRNDTLYINGQPIKEPYISEDSRKAHINFPAITVPENKYFVLGDNRPYSDDSRIWFYDGGPASAFVDRKALVGKPFLVFWPPHHLRIVFGFRLKAPPASASAAASSSGVGNG
jgi:signal peptidase I